jgi:hypothetical protein
MACSASSKGPDSKSLKYAPSLCHRCNTTVSQPFDVAYDTLAGWLDDNEDTVLRHRLIDFEDVFGPGFAMSQLNLYKYFAKSFGCRLVDAGQTVPREVVRLLGQSTFRTGL